ncbi:hypothetical protein Esti_000406 [Eimeria stiedai]
MSASKSDRPVPATLRFLADSNSSTFHFSLSHELSGLTYKAQHETEVSFDRWLKALTDDLPGEHSASGSWLAAPTVPPKHAVSSLRMGMLNEPLGSRQSSELKEGSLEAGASILAAISGKGPTIFPNGVPSSGKAKTPNTDEKATPRLTPSSPQTSEVVSWSKAMMNDQEAEEFRRGEGYIIGAAYSGPEFQPQQPIPLEDPPIFAMENVSLLPILRTRKPINQALAKLTSQLRKTAVDYCAAQQLNCNEEQALQTAISVSIRTSPVASMLRQISASLSAVEVGSLIGVAKFEVETAVALLRSLIAVTGGRFTIPPPLGTHLHDHQRNMLVTLLYGGREEEACSLGRPPSDALKCKTFIVEVPARTGDQCPVPGHTQGIMKSRSERRALPLTKHCSGTVPQGLNVHGFELSCMSSLRCFRHITSHQPHTIDGNYTLASMTGETLIFERTPSEDSNQPLGPPGRLYMYRPAAGDNHSEIVKNALVAFSPQPGGGDTEGPLAYLPASALDDPSYQQHAPSQCRKAEDFTFPYCLLKGLTRWRFTNFNAGCTQ